MDLARGRDTHPDPGVLIQVPVIVEIVAYADFRIRHNRYIVLVDSVKSALGSLVYFSFSQRSRVVSLSGRKVEAGHRGKVDGSFAIRHSRRGS